jgi:transposase
MIRIEKIADEYDLLADHYRKAKTPLIRERAHAALLSMQGRSVPDIAEILMRDNDTVRDWLKNFVQIRVASIFPSYTGNANAAKLTKEQQREIQETLGSPPASTAGRLPSAFWDVKQLKEYLRAEYGVVYESDRSYHHLFAVSDFSFKLPDGLDRRRNDTLVAERMREIVKEIKSYMKQRYLVFAADECSLSWETEYRRAWLPKGKKTILKVNRKNIRQHYFGALELVSGKENLISMDWQNTATITGALRELTKRYRGKKLCIVWDNAQWHRAKELRDLLGPGKEFAHIRFIWLPPYAPDNNPQEHVWKIGKDAVGNIVTDTFEQLKGIFEHSISGKLFDYQMSGI